MSPESLGFLYGAVGAAGVGVDLAIVAAAFLTRARFPGADRNRNAAGLLLAGAATSLVMNAADYTASLFITPLVGALGERPFFWFITGVNAGGLLGFAAIAVAIMRFTPARQQPTRQRRSGG